MSNEEDKQFLLLQRQKGRPGCMLGVDVNLTRLEKRIESSLEKATEKRKRTYEEMTQICR